MQSVSVFIKYRYYRQSTPSITYGCFCEKDFLKFVRAKLILIKEVLSVMKAILRQREYEEREVEEHRVKQSFLAFTKNKRVDLSECPIFKNGCKSCIARPQVQFINEVTFFFLPVEIKGDLQGTRSGGEGDHGVSGGIIRVNSHERNTKPWKTLNLSEGEKCRLLPLVSHASFL